jgi:gliding motility-associated-like protein
LAKLKHIISLFVGIVSLLAGNTPGNGQATAPVIHCIAVDSAGAATVTWTIPTDTTGFVSYNIYTSKTRSGTYVNSANVSPANQNSVTISSINAGTVPYYFYTTTTLGTVSAPGDTVESIFLTVANFGGVALLKWTALYPHNLPSFNGWYYIYREYKYTWTLLDSTKSLSYSDTITYCSADLNYRIVANDASGCQSSSNWAGGTFQDNISTAMPMMDSVSVGPGGNVEISWFPSSSKNVVGYYIYEYIGGAWTTIDSVYGINTTSFNFTGGSPGTGSLTFCVAGFDSCHIRSALDNQQHTIYLQQKPDNCTLSNKLSWTKYIDAPPVTGVGGGYNMGAYEIYVSINGGAYKKLVTDPADSLVYTQTGLSTAENICYFVVAVDSTHHNITASSNIICYQVGTPPKPNFDYMRSATVINNSSQNQVNWYVDTGAGIQDYIIKRSNEPGTKQATIDSVPAVASTLYYSFTDPSADPNIQSYTYKVYAENSCSTIMDSTLIGQTIYLTASGDNSGTNSLSWSPYQDWTPGSVNKYDIYRNEDGGAFSFITSVSGATTDYTDNVSAIITGQGIFGYYVQAIEQGTPYNLSPDTSTSNIAYAYQDPRMYIPNAFDPKGVNKIFRPVTVFVDMQNYDFTIYDRWGQLLFETTDPTQGWDGTFHGPLVQEGVYIYHIQYTSGKGEYFNQRGWVMMLK